MIAAVDWQGIATVIAAAGAAGAAVIGAINHRTVTNVDRKTDTPGDPRALGQIVADVGNEVAPHDDGPPAH
jgi:hypothetical protein